MPAADFPLIALQPVANARHGWVALMLETAPAADSASLGRLFCEFGLYDALGGLPCIVALPDADRARELAEYVPAHEVILRLPAALCADPAAAAALVRLHKDGFRLLLDGLPAQGGELHPAAVGLALAAPAGGAAAAGWLKRLPGPHLATGVATPQQHAACKKAGFHWFAGAYPLHGAADPAAAADTSSNAILLKLLALVARDATTHEIETVLKQDPNLSYHLLKLVNSVAFALTQKINSFGQALQLLGRRQLQRWLQLLLYANPVVGAASPLLPRAALRAALLEELLRREGGQQAALDQAFMTGMFSLLDALLGMPLDQIIPTLNLADAVGAALLRREGRLGVLLSLVEAGEHSPAAVGTALAAARIEAAAWAETLAQACNWAVQVSREGA